MRLEREKVLGRIVLRAIKYKRNWQTGDMETETQRRRIIRT